MRGLLPRAAATRPSGGGAHGGFGPPAKSRDDDPADVGQQTRVATLPSRRMHAPERSRRMSGIGRCAWQCTQARRVRAFRSPPQPPMAARCCMCRPIWSSCQRPPRTRPRGKAVHHATDIRHIDAADFLPRPCSLLHCSPVPAPCSPPPPVPCSLFPVPFSLFPVPLLPWQQPATNDRHREPGCPSSWKERIRASTPPCGRRPHGLSVPSHRHLPGAARCGAQQWKCRRYAASARSAVAAILRQPLPQAPAAAEARSRSWPAAPCMAPIDRTPGRRRCT